MRRDFFALLSLLVLCLAGCLPTGTAEIVVAASPLRVDRQVDPLDALRAGTEFVVFDKQPAELVWVTGCTLDVVDSLTGESRPELLADSTVDFRWPEWHNEQLQTNQSLRLFSLGRGTSQFHFPRGFGLPVRSHEPFWWSARVMNLDPYFPASTVVPHCSLHVTRERGSQLDYLPLLSRDFSVKKDGKSSWTLPPGGVDLETDITENLRLKHRTTVHGLTVTMHSWAKKFELWDSTTEERLLELKAETEDKTGRVLSIEQFSDHQGFTIDPTHRYRIRATYANPTDKPITGVAYAMLYVFDHDFHRPKEHP